MDTTIFATVPSGATAVKGNFSFATDCFARPKGDAEAPVGG